MNNFSISELAQFSGVKAHTIRMWEQRYDALKPKRTEGNTRYYDNNQLRRLLNIVSLAELDYKISDLCMLPDKKLFKLVQESNTGSGDKSYEYFIAHLISAGISYDEPGFEKIFSHCITRYGMKEAYLNIIYPLLVRVGFMWSADTIPPAHEHFISNLLRQKLFTAIDSLPLPKAGDDDWLLFLPENEFHELGLLFASYLLRLAGKKVIYLGSNVPFESLKEVVKEVDPKNLLLFLVHENLPEVIQQYLDILSKQFKGKNIFVAGHQKLTGQLKKGSNIHFLHSVADLEQQASPAPGITI
jgi:DNA-binding transcriptional MerR regulator/methanogenic corrinoid protein MtbC1